MTFAGDMPEGCYARLMKANMERLVEGAADSTHDTQTMGKAHPDLAILISCLERKLVLKQRVDEEIEAIESVLGADTTLTGFYSYGELCPMDPEHKRAEKQQGELLGQIMKANEELTRFAYVISHDLKTPLRGISTLAAWLEQDAGEHLSPDAKQHI